MSETSAKAPAPKIGFVSLGCPKALVDSEHIITRLRAEGYELSASYEGADAVVVNTCGFLNSAKEESLAAIGEALAENGKVIVTGCLGVESDRIRAAHPQVLAITGPHQYEAVVEEVHKAVPRPQIGSLHTVHYRPRADGRAARMISACGADQCNPLLPQPHGQGLRLPRCWPVRLAPPIR